MFALHLKPDSVTPYKTIDCYYMSIKKGYLLMLQNIKWPIDYFVQWVLNTWEVYTDLKYSFGRLVFFKF